MRQRQLKISGLDVLDKGHSRYLESRNYDTISLVSMTLYLMKDIEWIEDVWFFDEIPRLSLVIYIKEGVIMAHVENAVKAGIVRIEEHLKGMGLSVDYNIEDNLWRTLRMLKSGRFVRIGYWANWEPIDQEKNFWSVEFKDGDIGCYEPSGT